MPFDLSSLYGGAGRLGPAQAQGGGLQASGQPLDPQFMQMLQAQQMPQMQFDQGPDPREMPMRQGPFQPQQGPPPEMQRAPWMQSQAPMMQKPPMPMMQRPMPQMGGQMGGQQRPMQRPMGQMPQGGTPKPMGQGGMMGQGMPMRNSSMMRRPQPQMGLGKPQQQPQQDRPMARPLMGM